MRVIDWPRASGKTTTLVGALALDPDAVVIVANERMADHFRRHLLHRTSGYRGDEAREMARRQVVSAGNLAVLRGRRLSRVYVDELDGVLAVLIGHPVSVATLTGDDQEPVLGVLGQDER